MAAESVQQDIIKELMTAVKSLQAAHAMAVKKNPMAQDLVVFHKLQQLQKEISSSMQEISKLRGL